jgi:hypothetical protein
MMNNLRIYHTLRQQFCQWQPAERITRTRNLALLVTGLFLGKSVHLSHVVRKWPLPGKDPSLVNRLRRFLDNPRLDVRLWYQPLARQLLQMFVGKTIHLVIDCTKVGFGFRMLMVGIAYRKRILPLIWSIHRGRKGHVRYQEQIALLRSIYPLVPREATVWLLGDAGFQSVHLLRWLGRRHWHFVIRQPGRCKIWRKGFRWTKIGHLPLQEGQTRVIGWVRLTEKHNAGWFWLILHWEPGEDEPWYLVSDRRGSTDLIRRYRKRMWTEETYGDMKGHGFDLESTHLDDADRISRLVLGVCIAYVWLVALGSWVVKNGKRHFIDVKSRRDKSYFRLGWDWLERCLRLQLPFAVRVRPYL